MYHSITFTKVNKHSGEKEVKNTWDDWHLIPTSRPVFNPPSVKTNYIDIPGADGSFDFTETLTKFPVYNNREGSVEFIVENGHKEWYEIYSEIMDYLHGQYVEVMLEDDTLYYYEGRFTVNQWKSDQHWSLITLDYVLNPYKMSVRNSTDDWKWDQFDFETGIIPDSSFSDITVDSDDYVYYDYNNFELIGRKPVCPTITVSSSDGNGITVYVQNRELGIELEKTFLDGSTKDSDIILSNISDNKLRLGFKGYGTVSIGFRSGRL